MVGFCLLLNNSSGVDGSALRISSLASVSCALDNLLNVRRTRELRQESMLEPSKESLSWAGGRRKDDPGWRLRSSVLYLAR